MQLIGGNYIGIAVFLLLAIFVAVGLFSTIKWLTGLTRNKNQQ